jgi:hypothetical protein
MIKMEQMTKRSKIRIFISYSRQDKELVKKLVSVIKNDEISVLWDENLMAGTGFHEQIKDYISHAHIFMPILTRESSNRGWVHQEIGYAMALNIPVFPLTTEEIEPGGMLQMIQAVKISEDESILREQLNQFKFRTLLKNTSQVPLYQCASLPEERTKMMATFANNIAFTGNYGLVRQKGGLSSFHIPSECVRRKVWHDRYYPETKSEYHKSLQRSERLALQNHAQEKGCRLIITAEYAILNRHFLAAKTRIISLLEFLENSSLPECIVAIQKEKTDKQSLTIVGDWFMAESVSFKDGDGYMNTFFTHNASEIKRRIEDFDCELDDLLEEWGWKTENSREKAIEELNRILNGIRE